MHSVWRTCNKIRATLNRIRANLWDCFVSFDTQGNHLISEQNFIAVLSGPLGKKIGLSNQEICELADYFRTQDGRIFYAQFCAVVHENNPQFESNFPFTTGQEWEDALQTNCLSLSEQRRLEIILSKIASLVNWRKHVLKPYFQDYELISKNCGVVSYAHFARLLYFLDITLASEEMNLLIKKFAKDSYTVNYVAFIKTIEEIQDFLKKHQCLDKGGDLKDGFPGRIIEVKLPKLSRPEIGKIKTACVFPKQLHFLPLDPNSKRIRDIQEIMLRLQEHALKNRIRVAQYFQDYDVFNVGRITKNQFERGFDEMRNSGLGKLYLAPEEIENLIAFYKDPNDMERICWRTFEDDIEQVFTIKHLHKHPNCKVISPSKEVKTLPRKGHQEWGCLKNVSQKEMKAIYERTLKKIIQRVKERRFSLRPYFRDFDKNNRGHVSRAQLRQALAVAAIPLTQGEISSLEFMYNNDIGFHYLDFVSELEQFADEFPDCDGKQSESRMSTSKQLERSEAPEEKDIDLILAKIKAKAVCNGIQVNEFLRRFDTRNEKVVTRLEFHRGLDQLKCDLTCTEVNTLMDHFTASDRPGYIDYCKFSQVVEGAMVQGHLEKSPLASPVRHVPSEATPRSFLNFDERQILMRTLNVLSTYADCNLEEVFKDFDKQVNSGTVTKNQLIRALSVRKIISALNANELDVLFKCFAVGYVAEPKFDYRSFLNALNILRQNKVAVPF
ncbi:uncharacterized protein LOC100170120 isoform X1 [Nasonia vitripennis]|uniref:EF-hand domain-containing protein n=1 Tax=Nasonia vitripennis TaxID=7425 RepID=A0A7M7QDV3_NASVI|nr:uncharacterized protein LOC100170120 isoform X1 [Nasonia vitripennis]